MREYVIAKYLRLSIDDAVTDSLSIPNQRRILDRYIDKMELPGAQVLEFVDNGHSGTTFQRPAIQELLELVQCGKVDCLLCKDFSRFGRNAVETEYFIEKVFPLFQARFISVDDRFDSDDYKGTTGGLDVAMRYILHEQYSRDLSHKVKSAKRVQMARGENIVANAIYGYRKNEQGRWEPDGEAADVVRRIFSLAVEGVATAQIRDWLFSNRVPTPGEHISMKRGKELAPACVWTARMVTHMLTNEQYTGVYISGKQTSKAIGSHSKIHTDKSEWIVIPDRHPPIISKEDFAAVQIILDRNQNSITTKPTENVLLRDKNRPRRERMVSGERLPNNVIYGYGKDGTGHLTPDPAVAKIIQEMYGLAAQGMVVSDIREILTVAYPHRRWTDRTIRGILQNIQYTGAYVSGKILKDYATGRKYHTAKEDWIVFPDKHPAIVSKELFAQVQEIFAANKVRRRNMRPREYLLRGKVACGCCHYALSYDTIQDPVFRCHHTQADPAAACHKMKVNVQALDEAILAIIEKQIQVVLGCGISEVRAAKGQDHKIAECEKEIQAYVAKRQEIYEQFVMEEISCDAYLIHKNMCSARIEKLNEHLAMLRTEVQAERNRRKTQTLVKEMENATPKELVQMLVKKIYVSPGNQIEIEWLVADFTVRG